MSLAAQIKPLIQGDLFEDEETLTQFSKDASIFEIKPQLVIAPKNTADLKKIVEFVNLNPHQNLSLTPRAAGTCMSGGAINDSIILDMTKYFNQVLEFSADSAITQPGVYYRDFEPKTLEKGLLLPCFTSSRELNTVGGMVGNNSAGEKTLMYGQTEKYVKKLKVVLSDGNEYLFSPLTQEQLDTKLAQKDFEGFIYNRIVNLLRENWQLIKQAQPQTSKNSTGYYLWNVWDGTHFDLTKLITGSQGTLGIVTEIEFQLVKPKNQKAMLEIELPTLDYLDQVVNEVLKFKPESFECFDDQTLIYSLKYLPDLAKDFKQSHGLGIYFQFLPEFLMKLSGKIPKLVLIAEFTGNEEDEELKQAETAKASLEHFGIHTRVVRSHDEEKYWIIRRDSFNMLRKHSGDIIRTAPFIDDICVNPQKLPVFLPKLQAILAQYKDRITYTIAGHIGNGNFHIIPLMDLNKEAVKQVIPELSSKVFSLVSDFGGTMAAEHNDGLVRGSYLPLMYGEEVYQLFKEVKEIFDPNNIFNPHKKTDATIDFAIKHICATAGIAKSTKDYSNIQNK